MIMISDEASQPVSGWQLPAPRLNYRGRQRYAIRQLMEIGGQFFETLKMLKGY
jgi:hypothetical protein